MKAPALRTVAACVAVASLASLTGCTRYTKSLARAGISEEQFVVNNAALAYARMQKKFPKLDHAVAQAEGVLIIPHLVKAGLFVGAQSGVGVMLHRKEGGKFGPPAFFNVASTSGGLQVGYADAAVVIVFKKGQTMLRTFEHGMSIGGDASVALGSGLSASDTSYAHRAVVQFVDSKGAFAGISIQGSMIAAKERMTRAYYGPLASAKGVLLEGKFDNDGATEIRSLLDNRASPQIASAK
jgi:lipid-binding SYLF domain-containing protein